MTGTHAKIFIFFLLVIDVATILYLLVHGKSIPLLFPTGAIAIRERNLFVTAVVFGMSAIIPIFIITAIISWKFRAGNRSAKFTPDKTASKLEQVIWWAIPTVGILMLAPLTWASTHALDPYKPLISEVKPLTIQVVALQWKWLFIYPEQNIATVNYVQFPVHTPIQFQLTAEAPMSSFWIPSLSGQIYAMTGMNTQLHIIADTAGDYNGSDAEINGSGFSGMKFIAHASTQSEFDAWVRKVKLSSRTLNQNSYSVLAKPSKNSPRMVYSSTDPNLYNMIIMKYNVPGM